MAWLIFLIPILCVVASFIWPTKCPKCGYHGLNLAWQDKKLFGKYRRYYNCPCGHKWSVGR